MFINSFIQNMDAKTTGELTFEMMLNEQAGIKKGFK